MNARDAILALFTDDDIVYRAADIIRLTRRGEAAVRNALTGLIRDGSLHRIAHSQYARTMTAIPKLMRDTTVEKLERRIAWLDERIAKLEAHWANRGSCT